MQFSNLCKTLLLALVALAAMCMGSSLVPAQNKSKPPQKPRARLPKR